MARISVAAAKAKGRNLQNWVASKISELTGYEYGHDDQHLIESRPMGQKGVDVIIRGEVRKKFPFSVECKSGESIGWQSAVKQARANQQKETDWLLFMKTKMFKSPMVMMEAEVFFRLLSQIKTDFKAGLEIPEYTAIDISTLNASECIKLTDTLFKQTEHHAANMLKIK
ncbi:MAG: hypothetical protein WC783_00815 [Candidatus Paceibacterota bacterium]|jgi:DUF4097 and DUF4098 domain-containing protein YvlB